MNLTDEDIKNAKTYCADFHGGWIPVDCDFTELSVMHGKYLKEEFGDDWFLHESVQRVVNPSITLY